MDLWPLVGAAVAVLLVVALACLTVAVVIGTVIGIRNIIRGRQ